MTTNGRIHWLAPSSALLVIGIGLFAWNCAREDEQAFDAFTAQTAALLTAPLPGAVFTTTADGSAVDANLYPSKDAVYLDGGPGPHAPASAAGLPEGDYFFQVTDPSGRYLLSDDHISCRRVHVSAAGVIDRTYAGTNYVRSHGAWTPTACRHVQGTDQDHASLGAITVQLMPYEDTPNRGGVYKVWMTRVEDYRGDPAFVPTRPSDAVNGESWDPGNVHGFVPSASKTDNYKVNRHGPPFVTPTLALRKFHDRNVNGVQDPGEEDISGWEITLADPIGSTNNYFTPADVLVTGGLWTASEEHRSGTLQTVAFLDGVAESTYPHADGIVAVTFAGTSGEHHEIRYGNVGLGSATVCKVYDRDGDGVADPGEPPVVGWSFSLSGTTVTGASVGPMVGTSGTDGCASFAGLLPGSYTVTEASASDPWTATGATTQSFDVVSTLTGDVLAGTQERASFTNMCLGTAAFGTKGYWHNVNGLAEMTDGDIALANLLAPYASPSSYFDAGDEPFDGLFSDGSPVAAVPGAAGEVIAPAGSPRAEVSAFLVDPNAGGDPREQLAQQLLAFFFNAQHRLDDPAAAIRLADGSYVSASELVTRAITVWSGSDGAAQTSMQTQLEALNSSDAVQFIHWTPCSVP